MAVAEGRDLYKPFDSYVQKESGFQDTICTGDSADLVVQRIPNPRDKHRLLAARNLQPIDNILTPGDKFASYVQPFRSDMRFWDRDTTL